MTGPAGELTRWGWGREWGRGWTRWWWVPAGLLIAWAIAAAIGSGWALAGMAIYTALNLLGTAMLLREIRDQGEGAQTERWRLLTKLAFVFQLPVGTVAVLAEFV